MWKGEVYGIPSSHTSAKHQGHTHRATERPRLVAKVEGTQTLTTRVNQIHSLRVARQKTILVTRLHSVHVRELLWRPSSHVKHLPRGVNMCVLTRRQSDQQCSHRSSTSPSSLASSRQQSTIAPGHESASSFSPRFHERHWRVREHDTITLPQNTYAELLLARKNCTCITKKFKKRKRKL